MRTNHFEGEREERDQDGNGKDVTSSWSRSMVGKRGERG